VRQGDDYVEVAGRQQLFRARQEPAGLLEVLTLGTVTVTARVEAHTLVSATVPARLKTAPEDLGAAVRDIPDDLALFWAGSMGLHVGWPVAAQDMGEFYAMLMPRGQWGSAALTCPGCMAALLALLLPSGAHPMDFQCGRGRRY